MFGGATTDTSGFVIVQWYCGSLCVLHKFRVRGRVNCFNVYLLCLLDTA